MTRRLALIIDLDALPGIISESLLVSARARGHELPRNVAQEAAADAVQVIALGDDGLDTAAREWHRLHWRGEGHTLDANCRAGDHYDCEARGATRVLANIITTALTADKDTP